MRGREGEKERVKGKDGAKAMMHSPCITLSCVLKLMRKEFVEWRSQERKAMIKLIT